MLRDLLESTGSWELWKGLERIWCLYFEGLSGRPGKGSRALIGQSTGYTPELLEVLADLDRPESRIRQAIDDILSQEFPDSEAATEHLCSHFEVLSRPETEILLSLMVLGSRRRDAK